jgi:hypothetical protein
MLNGFKIARIDVCRSYFRAIFSHFYAELQYLGTMLRQSGGNNLFILLNVIF